MALCLSGTCGGFPVLSSQLACQLPSHLFFCHHAPDAPIFSTGSPMGGFGNQAVLGKGVKEMTLTAKMCASYLARLRGVKMAGLVT